MHNLKPGHVLGDYTIIRFVARGGMGEVYEAHDNKLGRKVALKVVIHDEQSGHDSQDLVRRFMLEARNLAKVNHPNVVTIHTIHNTGDTQYIAMEYVDGISLKDFLEEYTFSPEVGLVLFEQILSGVKRLHEHNIIHRDLKPSNILIRVDGQIKILDFGIAKSTELSATTNPGTTVGTPFYMAPELRKFKPASYRSDLWSLGAIFFECLTGEMLTKRMEGDEFKFTKRDRELIPEALRALIACLCAPDPRDRYARASEAMDDLQNYRMTKGNPSSSALAEFHTQLNEVKKSRSVTSFEIDISPPAERLESHVRQAKVTSTSSRPRRKSKSALRKEQTQWTVIGIVIALAAVTSAIVMMTRPTTPPLAVRREAPLPAPPPEIPAQIVNVTLDEPKDKQVLWLEAAQNPVLSWKQVPVDGTYDVQIALDSEFRRILVNEEASGNSFLPSKILPEGEYYWRMKPRTGNATEMRSLIIARLEPVILVAPQANLTIETADRRPVFMDFEWSCREMVKEYRLQVARDDDFRRPALNRTITGCSVKQLKFPAGQYYWRVRPDLPKGLREIWSQARQFAILEPKFKPAPPRRAPTPVPRLATKPKKLTRTPAAASIKPPSPPPLDVPLLVSPGLGVEAPARRGRISIEFSWLRVPTATSYTLEIAKDKDFSDVVEKITSQDPKALLEQATHQGRLYWRVKAFGNKRESRWSEPSYLDIK